MGDPQGMHSARERRHQSRFSIADDEQLRGELEGRSERASVQIADLSLGGAGLVVAGPELAAPSSGIQLGLEGAGGFLGSSPVDVVHVHRGERTGLLGVRFRQPDEPFLQTICRFLIDRHSQSADRPRFTRQPHHFELVRDLERVRALLRFCARQQRSLRVYSAAGLPAGTVRVSGLDGDVVTGCCSDGELGLSDGQSCYLVVSTFTSAYVVLSSLRRRRAAELGFAVSDHLLVGSTRRGFRVGLKDDFPVYLEFLHPHVPGKLVRKLATEVGPAGMSFELHIEDDLLVPGTVIDSAVIRMPDGRSLGCRCSVRHVVRAARRYTCGVECTDFQAGDQWQWVRTLLDKAHPGVRAADPSELDEVWDVFDRAGYLEEKPVELMEMMREPFRRTWADLAQARGDSQCWLFRDEGHAMATVSMSRIYSRTWLFHHLGADLFHFERKQDNLDAIAQIALRTAPQWIAGLHSDGYALTYFDANKHFNRWSWFGFIEQHDGRGELISQRLTIRDVRVDGADQPPHKRSAWARAATPRELRWISDDLLRRDGPLVHQAFDFPPEAILLESMAGTPHDSALARRREVFVGGTGRRVGGYAIVESAAPGVNIFSLYDTCRIVLTSTRPGRNPDDVRAALLAAAARHFRQRKSPCFLYLTGPGDAPPPADEQGFEAQAVRTVMTLRLLLQWAESVDRVWTQGWPSRP